MENPNSTLKHQSTLKSWTTQESLKVSLERRPSLETKNALNPRVGLWVWGHLNKCNKDAAGSGALGSKSPHCSQSAFLPIPTTESSLMLTIFTVVSISWSNCEEWMNTEPDIIQTSVCCRLMLYEYLPATSKPRMILGWTEQDECSVMPYLPRSCRIGYTWENYYWLFLFPTKIAFCERQHDRYIKCWALCFRLQVKARPPWLLKVRGRTGSQEKNLKEPTRMLISGVENLILRVLHMCMLVLHKYTRHL